MECPLCRRPADESQFMAATTSHWLRCAVCGTYAITNLAKMMIEKINANDPRLQALSAHTRQANVIGGDAHLGTDNWEQFAAAHMHVPVSMKLRRLLDHVQRETTRAGDVVQIHGALIYPLIDAQKSEMGYLRQTLLDQGLLADKSGGVVITPAGWERLEPSGGGGVPRTCFVAMSFEPEIVETAYDQGIKPAVQDDCGFDVIQLSKVHHNENINDRIMSDIRRAQFVVADFTLHRGGVYFEAGFALGLGKPVVWTCRESDFKDTHFDTRPYNHILWSSPDELRSKLRDRVRAVIPNAKLA